MRVRKNKRFPRTVLTNEVLEAARIVRRVGANVVQPTGLGVPGHAEDRYVEAVLPRHVGLGTEIPSIHVDVQTRHVRGQVLNYK